MNYGAMAYSFEYNDSGIRTSKTVNGIEHVYTLNGSQIVTESWTQSDVEHVIVYLYDESGAPIGMQYRTSNYAWAEFDNFYFEKNLFGDIVAIYNEAGTKIGYYKYDAWGACTATTYLTSTTAERNVVTNLNPFRYRGYYFDTETGFYYLQSRYYNPQWGRFLNADGYISTQTGLLGHNMYIYCNSNPVNLMDENGCAPQSIKNIVQITVQYIIDPAVQSFEDFITKYDYTLSIGNGGNGSLSFLSAGTQKGVSFDTKGNIAIQETVAAGPTSSKVGLAENCYFCITNAPSIYALEGLGAQIGGSFAIPIPETPIGVIFGGEINYIPNFSNNTSNDYYGITGSLGVGLPGTEVHAEVTYTQTSPISQLFKINIFDVYDQFYNWVEGW